MQAATLPKSLRPYANRLLSYYDERAYDNPIFLNYIPGWKSWTDPVGIQHADAVANVTEAVYALRNAVRCDCAECKKDTP